MDQKQLKEFGMQILKKWEKTGLLNGFNEQKKNNAAHCMEAQINFNEENNDSKFKRISVPLLNRVMRASSSFERNHFDLNDGLNEAQNTHIFRTKFDLKDKGGLEQDAEYVANLSEELLHELDELFGDQYNKYITFHGFEVTDHGNILLHYDM